MALDFVAMTPFKHMLSLSSLPSKNNRGTRQKWWGNKGIIIVVIGSMSLLNMALSAFVSGWGHLISHLPPWVWVILFDHSSAHCLVIMTPDHLTSNTAKSVIVPPICSREVGLCKNTQPPSDISHKTYCLFLSRVDDVGNIMAHLRSRSLPVDFSSLSRKVT